MSIEITNTQLRRFLDLLESSGDIVSACLKANISLESYSKSYKDDEKFKTMVNAAIIASETESSRRLRQLGSIKAAEMMNGVKVVKEKRVTKYEIPGDASCEIPVELQVTTEITHLPPPDWLVKHMLGSDNSIEHAINILAREGLIPKDKVLLMLGLLSDSKRDIRQILGESSNASDVIDRAAIVQAQADLFGLQENIFPEGEDS